MLLGKNSKLKRTVSTVTAATSTLSLSTFPSSSVYSSSSTLKTLPRPFFTHFRHRSKSTATMPASESVPPFFRPSFRDTVRHRVHMKMASMRNVLSGFSRCFFVPPDGDHDAGDNSSHQHQHQHQHQHGKKNQHDSYSSGFSSSYSSSSSSYAHFHAHDNTDKPSATQRCGDKLVHAWKCRHAPLQEMAAISLALLIVATSPSGGSRHRNRTRNHMPINKHHQTRYKKRFNNNRGRQHMKHRRRAYRNVRRRYYRKRHAKSPILQACFMAGSR